MSLCHFLGDTSEIRIVDFYLSDGGNSYTISELNEQTGLSRVTLTKKIPELIQNKILEVDQQAGGIRTFKLARTRIVDLLAAIVLANSFDNADEPLEDNEKIEKIRKATGLDDDSLESIPVAGYKLRGETVVLIKNDKETMCQYPEKVISEEEELRLVHQAVESAMADIKSGKVKTHSLEEVIRDQREKRGL